MLLKDKIKLSTAKINTVCKVNATTALVLGTGLGSMEELLINKYEIDYKDIPFFPVSTVKSHSGKLIIGELEGTQILIVSGRFHFYEGYSTKESTYYIHVIKALGISNIFLTNASGGLNPHYKTGQLVLVSDHINLFPENPLRGENDSAQGPRFPDMMHTYDLNTRTQIKKIAADQNIIIGEGVYLGWQGPSLETPAEYKMARIFGADLVGMSTVPEVIVSKYYGMKICVISIVSNVCFPLDRLGETTIDEVIRVVGKSAKDLIKLLSIHFSTTIGDK